jgi:hypothetical protein
MRKEIDQVIRLLRNNDLVWDADFEQIRHPLANLLDVATQFEYRHIEDQIDSIVSVLINEKPNRKLSWTEEDGELEIPNPVVELDEQLKRQAYIYQALADQSQATNKALSKLFRNL